ncbi:hypothetical protein [Tenacibaculum sp. C7A-26P2]|uniref:hypothetical protein n=1 Tax=Tenacibaculum sp. C7A-26P2 TaxID=3447504 RepID=UPI003F8303CB
MVLKKTIIFLFILIGTFSSCLDEGELTGDLIKNYHTDVKYTIEGQITNTPSKHHVIITSIGIKNDLVKNVGISDATVKITDNTNTWNFTELPQKGIYESDRYFAGKENVSYTLSITIKGKTYTATQTMPVADEINSAEFNALKRTGKETKHIFGMDRSAIWENVNTTSKEQVSILLTSTRGNHDIKNTHKRISFANPVPIENPGHFLNPNSGVYKTIRRYTLTSNYEKYMWSILSELGISGFGEYEPSSLASNFNNKEISGYFSAVSCKEYSVNKTIFLPRNLSVFDSQKQFKASYTNKGEFQLVFKPSGECELKGLGETLTGAYQIAKNEEILVYFKSNRFFKNLDDNLLRFYLTKLMKTTTIITPTEEIIRLDTYAHFKIENRTTLKSEDDVIWTSL